MKLVVEPSAVVGLATCLYNEDFRTLVQVEGGKEGWDVGVVFSGGNTSITAISKMFRVGEEVPAERALGQRGADGESVADDIPG